MLVAIHVESADLSEEDVEHLSQLNTGKTVLVADRELINELRLLVGNVIRLCESNIRPEERSALCTHPGSIACVAPDGKFYCCGLHVGEARYELGSVHRRQLQDIMRDDTLPHERLYRRRIGTPL